MFALKQSPGETSEVKAKRAKAGLDAKDSSKPDSVWNSLTLNSASIQPGLQRQVLPDDDPKTKKPSSKASDLLRMFWNGVTNTGLNFRSSSEREFDAALKDAAVSLETIAAIKNGNNVTYTFITNEKTGFIYVRERQDGNGFSEYYQSGPTGKTAIATPQVTSGQDSKLSKDNKSASEKSIEAASGGVDKEAPDEIPPPGDVKPQGKPKSKSVGKIAKTTLPPGWIGGQDQTWLPGTDHHGKPLQQGDLTPDLENALLKLIKQIKNSVSPPKELQVSVTLFRTDEPTPGYKYAAENLGFNIKKFLEARLPKSIKVTETHQFIDNGRTLQSYQQLHTITPIY